MRNTESKQPDRAAILSDEERDTQAVYTTGGGRIGLQACRLASRPSQLIFPVLKSPFRFLKPASQTLKLPNHLIFEILWICRVSPRVPGTRNQPEPDKFWIRLGQAN